MRGSSSSSSGGVSGLFLLGLLFVGLKLTGYIDWSWWYVTMPFWGGVVLVAIGFLVFASYIGIKALIAKGR